VYITDGLDKYYEKSTILRIYILTLKVRGSPCFFIPRIYIDFEGTRERLSCLGRYMFTLPHTSNEIWTLVQAWVWVWNEVGA